MKLFLVIFFCAVNVGIYAQRKIDVIHYKYEIEVSDSSDMIKGLATLSIKALENTNDFEFDFASGEGTTRISVAKKNGEELSLKKINANKFSVSTNRELLKGEQREFVFAYSCTPTDGLIIARNKHGKRTFFADNWPNRAHHWIPCVDDPADKASVEFIVTAPSHYQVISNGVQIEETNLPGDKKLTHYKEDVPLPTKVMVIGVADFAVQTLSESNCIPVSSWIYPEDKSKGFYDYALARDILAYYIKYIGPYAYKKLANVQSKTIFGGMENAGAIFYSEASVTGNRSAEALIAHEIVHQWFGNMATEKSFAHLWLSEGFATYLTHVYIESKYGTDSLRKRMEDEREEIIEFVKNAKRPVVDSTENLMTLLNANSYQKGGWVLHMLRRELGDSVFHKGVRKYYADYAGKNAETKDLQQVFELVSGKKLGQFFKQWLFTPENLELDISWKFDNTKKNVVLVVKQLQSALFEFPLELLIQESPVTMPKRSIKKITQRTQTIEFPAGKKPSKVEIDPMVSLLYDGALREMK